MYPQCNMHYFVVFVVQNIHMWNWISPLTTSGNAAVSSWSPPESPVIVPARLRDTHSLSYILVKIWNCWKMALQKYILWDNIAGHFDSCIVSVTRVASNVKKYLNESPFSHVCQPSLIFKGQTKQWHSAVKQHHNLRPLRWSAESTCLSPLQNWPLLPPRR